MTASASEAPYAGTTRVRFQGCLSARTGTPASTAECSAARVRISVLQPAVGLGSAYSRDRQGAAMPSRILKSHLAREPGLARMIEIDAEIARVGGRIAVLKSLRWPLGVERRFLKDFKAGRTRLPKVALQRPALEREARTLDRLMRRCDNGQPLGRWLHMTAWSYRVAVGMLRNLGTPRFTLASVALYGRPDTRPRGQAQTNLELAEHVLRITDEVLGRYRVPPAPETIPARRFARRVRERIDGFFHAHEVEVVLDPALPARATAGSRRICVRADARFSE